MQIVYFPESATASHPMISTLYHWESGATMELVDLITAMTQLAPGESLTVRAASPSELKRADAMVALSAIFDNLAEKAGDLLDQCPPQHVTGVLTSIRDAIEATRSGRNELLDQHAQ